MKTQVCILLICMLTTMASAFPGKSKKSPVLDNPSIRKSEREMNKQINDFQNHRRYSSLVQSHRSKASKKQNTQPATNGKGL